MDQLTKIIGETLQTLVEQSGWHLPINLAVVGSNGSLLAGRYVASDDGVQFETRAVVDERGVATPLNVFFTNERGDAARVLLELEGGRPQLFQ